MRNPLAEQVVSLKPSGIRKFFDLVAEMPDAISLGVGEPDFDTPWHIRDEGIYSLEKGRTFYTSNAGLKELRQEICNYLNRKLGVTYDADHEVLITVGGSEAIDIGLRAMINPGKGEEVLIPQPSYVSYEPCAILAGAKPVIIELKHENEFRLTAEELEAAITENSKILILPFPNNPTGAIMERKDLEAIAEVIEKHDLFVISDEIYSELNYNGEHVSIVCLPGMKERTILINGFSKAFAMTGWRLGYATGPAAIIRQMTKIHQFAIMCAPTTSQYAAVEALKNGEEDVLTMREAYNQRRRYLMHAFKEMGLECFEPFGAFYVFPCIKEFGMTSEEFATRLLQEEKVAVVPGTAFGDCGEGFLRISYAYSLEAGNRKNSGIHYKTPSEIIIDGKGTTMHIILHQPEIPANTGNIGRTCVATGTSLHLIEPLGFRLNEKEIKRAGMDYWEHLDVTRYVNFEEFKEKHPGAKIWMATTKAKHSYTDVSFGPDDFIMFGKESAGIPEEILVEYEPTCIRIPMLPQIRSLNLSNSVAIVLYEALRQNNFESMEQSGNLHRLHWKSEEE